MKRNKRVALVMMCAGMMFLTACSTKEVAETETAVVQKEVSEVERTEIAVVQEEVSEAEEMVTGQIISISMEEMKEKMATKENFLVSFVTIDCPYCQDFHSMLVDYIQEHIVTMYQVILDYEELPEEENRRIIKELFSEFNTVPGTFYVEDGENASYLDMYNLGVGMEVFDNWIQELGIEQ